MSVANKSIRLSVVMLSVVMLNVVMLSAVAPLSRLGQPKNNDLRPVS